MTKKTEDIKKLGKLSLLYFLLFFLVTVIFQGSGSLFGVAIIVIFGGLMTRYGSKYIRELAEYNNRNKF